MEIAAIKKKGLREYREPSNHIKLENRGKDYLLLLNDKGINSSISLGISSVIKNSY